MSDHSHPMLGAIDQGLYVFPLAPGTKAGQLLHSWSNQATNEPDVALEWIERFGADINYGIHCGLSGLVVLDADGMDVMRRVREWAKDEGFLLELKRTLKVTTPRQAYGEHVYFRDTAGLTAQPGGGKANPITVDGERLMGLDWRAANGYVVGPGSSRSDCDGRRYDFSSQFINWETGIRDVPQAVVDSIRRVSQLKDLQREQRAVVSPRSTKLDYGILKRSGPWSEYENTHTAEQVFMEHGWTKVPTHNANERSRWRRPGATSDSSAAVFADTGGITIFSANAGMVDDQLSGPAALKCSLMYPDRSVDDARDEFVAWLRHQGYGNPPDEVVSAKGETAVDHPDFGPVMATAAQLEQWLTGDGVPEAAACVIHGMPLVYPGCVNMIWGPSGVGKTWVIHGGAANDLINNRPVLFCDPENHPGVVLTRLLALGVPASTLTNPEMLRWLHADHPEARETLSKEAVRLEADGGVLVLVDGYERLRALWLPGLQDDNKAAVDLMSFFDRRVAHHGTAVVVIDHVNLSKSEGSQPSPQAAGAAHKRNQVSGIAYDCRRSNEGAALGFGRTGTLKLHIVKNRLGSMALAVGNEIFIDVTSNNDGSHVTMKVLTELPREAPKPIEAKLNDRDVEVALRVASDRGLTSREVVEALAKKGIVATRQAVEKFLARWLEDGSAFRVTRAPEPETGPKSLKAYVLAKDRITEDHMPWVTYDPATDDFSLNPDWKVAQPFGG